MRFILDYTLPVILLLLMAFQCGQTHSLNVTLERMDINIEALRFATQSQVTSKVR